MTIRKRTKRRMKHLARFNFRKRPSGDDLRKILIRAFHHHIKKFSVANPAAPTLKYSNQIRMRQRSSKLPRCQPVRRIRRFLGNQLDSSRLKIGIGRNEVKNRSKRKTAQILAQPKLPIDRLSFPLLPSLGHGILNALVAVFSV